MRANRWYTVQTLLTMLLAAGCNDVLDVHPINDTDASQAITTPAGARAAVAGLYDALQGTDVEASYYGGEMLFFGDLSADDVEHVGTFTTYRQIDQNDITSDNASVEGFWDALYKAVGRANIVLGKVPDVVGLDPVERDDLLGQAHFIRALTYHNLVKFWGDTAASGLGVPLVLVQPQDISEAGLATRATTGEVYAQILSDLGEAEALLDPGAEDTHRATVMAVHALRARVYLYQKNYVGAETEAQAVTGFSLAPQYGDLFTPEGDDTPEDVFRLHFDAVDYSWEGYYYRHDEASFGGRREIAPAFSLIKAYDTAYTGVPTTYNPTDLRGQWNIAFVDPTDGESVYGSKWPTGIGAENIQVFRFAEVLLIQAESEARQSKLVEAEATLTPIRTRAGLPAAGLDTMSQANAINAILNERRLELAMEGDRWPDLVRTGRVQTFMSTVAAFQMLYPIPLNELDVAPGLVQNPGY
jgi:hypothetical protein